MIERKRTGALDWDDVRYFAALAEAGSLSATARSLRVNHATVARRVGALEAKLGKMLFERRSDGYVLTVDGRALLVHAEAMGVSALEILRESDLVSSLSGLVRVTTTPALAVCVVTRALGTVRETHPDICVELLADQHVLSLERRHADMAIRFGRPGDGISKARRLSTVAFGFFVERALANAGIRLRLIGFEQDNTVAHEARWLRDHFPNETMALRSDGQLVQAEAAAAGLGIALLPDYLARRYPNLVMVEHGPLPPPRDVWLVIRSDLSRVPRVRAVADSLIATFSTTMV